MKEGERAKIPAQGLIMLWSPLKAQFSTFKNASEKETRQGICYLQEDMSREIVESFKLSFPATSMRPLFMAPSA